jgi:hypothetical protein
MHPSFSGKRVVSKDFRNTNLEPRVTEKISQSKESASGFVELLRIYIYVCIRVIMYVYIYVCDI